MSISKKVKIMLALGGKDHAGLADCYGISKQALSNKFYRDSFTAQELIKAADFCGCELVISAPGGNVVKFELADTVKED